MHQHDIDKGKEEKGNLITNDSHCYKGGRGFSLREIT